MFYFMLREKGPRPGRGKEGEGGLLGWMRLFAG